MNVGSGRLLGYVGGRKEFERYGEEVGEASAAIGEAAAIGEIWE